MVLDPILQFIRQHRRSPPLRLLAWASEKYLRTWNNQAFYEFSKNGERFAGETFAEWLGGKACVIWDVGANVGQWVLEINGVVPNAEMHSFEIIPSVRDGLVANTSGHPNIHIHGYGLSDAPGLVTVHWNPAHDTTSSVAPRFGSFHFRDPTTEIECEVTTVDLLAKEIAPPNLLKIDVEGHELAVLRGAQSILSSEQAPDLIQVEYGDTFIPTGSTLRALYALLDPHGYQVGRLFPNHVEFKSYQFEDDNFRMGNYLAARDPKLIALLTNRAGARRRSTQAAT